MMVAARKMTCPGTGAPKLRVLTRARGTRQVRWVTPVRCTCPVCGRDLARFMHPNGAFDTVPTHGGAYAF